MDKLKGKIYFVGFLLVMSGFAMIIGSFAIINGPLPFITNANRIKPTLLKVDSIGAVTTDKTSYFIGYGKADSKSMNVSLTDKDEDVSSIVGTDSLVAIWYYPSGSKYKTTLRNLEDKEFPVSHYWKKLIILFVSFFVPTILLLIIFIYLKGKSKRYEKSF